MYYGAKSGEVERLPAGAKNAKLLFESPMIYLKPFFRQFKSDYSLFTSFIL